MAFNIVSEITDVETIAVNTGIHEVTRLRRLYGKGRWRKRNGVWYNPYR